MNNTTQPLTGDQCTVFTFNSGEDIEIYFPTDIKFDSEPPTKVEEGSVYTYAIYTSDEISCNSISLVANNILPDWLVFTDIGDGTGVIQGAPAVGQAGIHNVELQANDGGGGYAIQNFDIEVIEIEMPNDDPERYGLGDSTFLMFYDPANDDEEV